jgi:hypothetical protein
VVPGVGGEERGQGVDGIELGGRTVRVHGIPQLK